MADCNGCHDPHGTAYPYDMLNDNMVSTNFRLCFDCHDGVVGSTNIKQYYPTSVGGAGAFTDNNHGHRVQAAGGKLSAGSPLPCYDCHVIHGSANGNTQLKSDERWSSLGDTKASAANSRKFCLGCHVTTDNKDGNGTTLAASNTANLVEGLPRLPSTGSNKLKLPSTVANHASTDATGCFACHYSSGSEYASATSNNAHNPGPGESSGGQSCGTCHSGIYTAMDNGSTAGYHHVVMSDAATYPNNATPGGTASDRTCLMCHGDHNRFSPLVTAGYRRANNLRKAITDPAPADNTGLMSTDFDNTLAAGGICVSCHANVQTKSAGNLKNDGLAPQATPALGKNAFAYSVHNYTTAQSVSTFSDSSIFTGNCSKCHIDTMTKTFQGSSLKFGLHDSAVDHLLDNALATLGGGGGEFPSENFCYGCHKATGDSTYGRAMSAGATAVQSQFGLASHHPVAVADQAGGTRVVDCLNCHNVHAAGPTADNNAAANPDNTYAYAAYGTLSGRIAFCLACHDGAPPARQVSAGAYVPADVKVSSAVMNKSTYASRAHWTSGQGQMMMQVACFSCHDRHGGAFGKLLDNTVKYHSGPVAQPSCTICHSFTAPPAPTGNNNTECFRCHTYAGTGYPGAESDRTAADNGYFALAGTSARFSVRWPGQSVYTGAASPHGTTTKTFSGFDGVTRNVNDCKTCHDVHGTANPYNQLKGTFGPQSYPLCFTCHGQTSTATDNIARFYPPATGGTNSGSRSGHRVLSATASLGPSPMLKQGDTVPCYDCHMTHGSANGNARLISDQRWSGIASTGTADATQASNTRKFCLGCHVTSDGLDGSGAAVSSTDSVEGVIRNNPGSYPNKLRLPSTVAEHVYLASPTATQGCYTCHGNDYSAATSANVHNPGAGESSGGTNCAACHSSIYNGMASGTTSYHHVMVTDNASYPTAAPSSATDPNRRCTMCHADHNIFRSDLNTQNSAGRGANLRMLIGTAPSAGTPGVGGTGNYDNTDYNGTSGGLCLSCHTPSAQLSKNQTNQKSESGSAQTRIVVPAVAGFGSSAHGYAVNSTFTRDGSAFRGNCVKCHNSDIDNTSFNSLGFDVHNGTSNRLLSQFGRTAAADNLQQGFCYGCHSEVGDVASGSGGKSTAGRDWYGSAGAAMAQAAEKVWKNFNASSIHSAHPLNGNGSTTASVECENCHNPHLVTGSGVSPNSRVVAPDNTLSLMVYDNVSNRTNFCLKCHGGSLPSYTNTSSVLVPYPVVMVQPGMNKLTYGPGPGTNQGRAHWNVSGQLQSGTIKGCGDCHDNHGSTAQKLLGPYDPATGTNRIGTTTLYGTTTPSAQDNAAVCGACHTSAGLGYPPATVTLGSIDAYEGYRDGTGYFSPTPGPSVTTVRWPGYGVWDNASASPHRASTKTGPSALGSRAVADCNGCHDPHGTAYPYDMLNDNMVSTNFRLCFDCHDGVVGSTNIKQYYPTSVGGAGAFTDNNHGHRVQAAGGKLSAGSPLPCYDCHVIHGSANGNTQLKSDERWSSLGDTKASAANSRKFCLGCHVTTDNKDGNGTTLAASNTANLVEGLPRLPSTGSNKLKLPSTVANHASTDATGCFACHYSATPYGTDPNANNAHNPGGGAGACDICHGPGGSGPTVVWPAGNATGKTTAYGSHLKALKTDTLSGTTDWAVQCNKCHTMHSGPVTVSLPPNPWTDPSGRITSPNNNMQARLGIDYASHGAIRLGGTSTDNTSEASLCWSCHANAANNVSEWGPGNANVALAGFPKVQFPTQHDATPTTFDYGWIWDSAYAIKVQDWTAGYWRDEYWWGAGTAADPGLKRRVVSVHAANFDPAGQSSSVAANVSADNTVNYTAPTLENKSSIRCSYCHDVHDLNKAQDPFNTAQKETKSGPPFLRGNFTSNPYPPDMPPRSGYLYPTTGGPTQGTGTYGNRFRANTSGEVFSEGTPRLFAFTYTTTNVKGGFFIDNNSGNPATGLTQSSVYGLCALCHGTDVDGMDFYTGKKLWMGTNGHSNSTLGGTGSNASELFDARRIGIGSTANNKYMEMQDGVYRQYWGLMVGYGSNDQGVGAWWNIFGSPQPCNLSAANCPPKNSGWYGGTPGSTTRGSGYATWYGGTTPPKPAHQFACSKCHQPHASGLPALLVTNCLDIGLANWTGDSGRVGPNASGNYWTRGPGNCHRKKGTERGWNILAPMQTQ
ncbi:MAG: cytochrome c3 family protein [Deltaproteobacteria bacterium]|nr:cytochrome c3 family protein [Deltaproteobacteria bacterium]